MSEREGFIGYEETFLRFDGWPYSPVSIDVGDLSKFREATHNNRKI